LFWQVQNQQAHFCVRLRRSLNLRAIKELSATTGANDVLVEWTPKDSRGNWRREQLPRSMTLRLLTYHTKGFRPLRLLTNVLDVKDVPYEQFWGLSLSEEGEVLFKGAYNLRWEIETTYLELKVQQGLEGGLRSRTAEGIYYEVAGHVLYYQLVRWLMVEAACAAGVSPLRLSFTAALEEINEQWTSAVVASRGWLEQTLRPRLLERVGSHQVQERPAPRREEPRRGGRPNAPWMPSWPRPPSRAPRKLPDLALGLAGAGTSLALSPLHTRLRPVDSSGRGQGKNKRGFASPLL
jgi:hypothetical protein